MCPHHLYHTEIYYRVPVDLVTKPTDCLSRGHMDHLDNVRETGFLPERKNVRDRPISYDIMIAGARYHLGMIPLALSAICLWRRRGRGCCSVALLVIVDAVLAFPFVVGIRARCTLCPYTTLANPSARGARLAYHRA